MAVKASNQVTLVDLTDAYTVIMTNEAHTFIGTPIVLPRLRAQPLSLSLTLVTIRFQLKLAILRLRLVFLLHQTVRLHPRQ
jgi:hypothetical protein